MKQTFTYTTVNGRQVQYCTCGCHSAGLDLSHMFACCDLTYRKFIKGGKVDEAMLKAVAEPWAEANPVLEEPDADLVALFDQPRTKMKITRASIGAMATIQKVEE
jgi:hypothetical protein